MNFHIIPPARWLFWKEGEGPLDITKLMVASCTLLWHHLNMLLYEVTNGYLIYTEKKSFFTTSN
jgi:hypothetical protein